jgi:hypothetical protein
MIKLIQLSVILISISVITIAQEPFKHEKKIITASDGNVYVNKKLPVYVRIATSLDPTAPSYVLPSAESSKFANPMYFDTEGRNTLRSPSAVDTISKTLVLPKHDIIFDIFVDGLPPSTAIKFNSSGNKFLKNNINYFGKGLQFDFVSSDATSGAEATYFSINKTAYQEAVKSQKTIDEQKQYTISYYSVDRVGNSETPKTTEFCVDLSAPETSFEIKGASKGNVLSSKASIGFSSKDTFSGVKHIYYSINDGPEKIYSAPIPLSMFKDGKTKIRYYAIDNVGNKEESKVLNTSTDAVNENTNNGAGSFSFYVDNEPPVMSFEIVGDQYKGKYLYISERSRFRVNAKDEKSGVDKIIYSINNNLLKEHYTEPFAITNPGLNNVIFAASDYVGNIALAKAQQVYLDKSIPSSNLSFRGKQFADRDTTFITSQTQLVLSTSESGSGIQSIEYTLNGEKMNYSAPFSIVKDGYQTLEYQTKDNVNNTEEIKKSSFFVDNTPPNIYYHFSVKAIGEKIVRDEKFEIYPSNAMLYVAATDNASGGEKIEYRINGKQIQSLIPIKGLAAGNYEIEITAYDVLKNKSSQVIRFAIEN